LIDFHKRMDASFSPCRPGVANQCAWHLRPRWVMAGLFLLFALQISPVWYPTPDAAGYLSIARNLGQRHTLANCGNRQLYYSPGYPLLISPCFLAGDAPFLLLSFVQWLFVGVFLWGVYHWASRVVPHGALLITILCGVNTSLWELYRRTLSEVAFMAVLMWVVNLLNDIVGWGKGEFVQGARLRGLLAGVLLILLALIRPAGILVAGGFALALGRASRHRRIRRLRALGLMLALGLPATGVLAGFLVRDRFNVPKPGAPTYLDQVIHPDQTVATQLVEGVRLRVGEIGQLLVPGMGKAHGPSESWLNVNMLIFAAATALFAVGWYRLVRATCDVLAWTFPLYLALYVVWPYAQGTRFFTPLLPLLWACIWLALNTVPALRLRWLVLATGAHLALALGYWLSVDLPRAYSTHQDWPAVRELAATQTGDAGPGLVSRRLGNVALLLQLDVDRPVRTVSSLTAIPRDGCWLVISREEKIPLGFKPKAGAGRMILLRREKTGPEDIQRNLE
jgi:hypothetical protein